VDIEAPGNPGASAVLGSLIERELDGLVRGTSLPPGVNVSCLHATGKRLVHLAARLGWTVRNSSDRKRAAVLLASPVDVSVTVLVTSQIRAGITGTLHGKIVRYGDPALVSALAEQVTRARNAEARQKKEKITAPPGAPAESAAVPRARDGRRAGTGNSGARAGGDPEPARPGSAESEPPARTVLSETPMLAKAAPPTAYYESGAVLERRWSDGTVDYACSWDSCDYASESYRSVATHYGRSQSHDKPAEAGDRIPGPSYEPQHRIAALEREIRDAWPDDAASYGPDEMAALLAERITAARADGRSEPEPREELTAEQVLDRIRRLADRGEYARQAEREHALADRIVGLQAELRETRDAGDGKLSEALEAVRDRDEKIDSMRSELDTIQELIRGIGGEKAD
jgi:hypothetical protein